MSEEKECNHEYHEVYNYETDFWECRCKHCRKMKPGYIGRSDLDSYWDKKKGEK